MFPKLSLIPKMYKFGKNRKSKKTLKKVNKLNSFNHKAKLVLLLLTKCF